jgi:hypothetical protein
VFPVVIHCFDWKKWSYKLIEVQQQSNENSSAAQYIKGSLRKSCFFSFVEYLDF